MSALYRVVVSPLPFPPCRQMQRAILCSAAFCCFRCYEWIARIMGNPSELDRMQARKHIQKRLQIAGVDQAELVDPWLLADADSRFAEFHGVQIHYKTEGETLVERSTNEAMPRQNDFVRRDDLMKREDVSELFTSSSSSCSSWSSSSSSSISENALLPSSSSSGPTSLTSPIIPAILLHGFGASLFSWERVMKPLAEVLQSRIIAFDRPAFGLTSRINVPLRSFATGSGDLVPMSINPYSVTFSSSATVAFIDFLQARKAVLIGHSAGCIIAADVYLRAPERIAALVMVAPAFFAPLVGSKRAQTHQEKNLLLEAFSNFWAKFSWVFSKIGAFVQFVLTSIRLLWICILTAVLRSDFGYGLIRIVMDKLSLQAVRMAWYDKKKINDYVIAGYTKPLKCRDWERALLEYVIALVGGPSSNEGQLPISQRLEEIECPVLVITGDSDVIVPAWNAKHLSRVFPNAQCHVIKNCGHLPQEETPDEFLRLIDEFLQQVQHSSSKEKTLNEAMVCMPA